MGVTSRVTVCTIELRCHIIGTMRAYSERPRPPPLPGSISAVRPTLTSDVQAVPAPDLALAVQHDVAPFVRHPDRVQRHLLIGHAEAARVLGRHRRLVVEQRWRGLRHLLDGGLVGVRHVGPVATR